ncbi:MAG: serine/threonine-protein phosphatase [bacterium]|nr:MAG: serine/threonine-protein phosphatase [bacterium]
MIKISNRYILSDKTKKTISGFDREAIENGLLEFISQSQSGRVLGMKSGRLWKKLENKYRIIDTHGMDNSIMGLSIPEDHEHVRNVKSYQIVFNTKKDRMDIEKDLNVGKNYVEISLGLNTEYILALDLPGTISKKTRAMRYITCNDISRNVSLALAKLGETEKLKMDQGKLKVLIKGAGELQNSILPHGHPDFYGFDVYGINKRAHDLGGDYYDFITHNNKLRVAIADVAGKDPTSSILMTAIHAGVSMGKAEDLESMMKILNLYLNDHSNPEDSVRRFVTALLLDLNKEGGFEFVNAGHEYPILISDDGPIELKENDVLLGFVTDVSYMKRYGNLRKDDVLLLYTDGITEAARDGIHFGVDRLKEIAMDHRKKPSEVIVKNIFKELEDFQDLEDDRTIVSIKKEI